MVMPQGITRAVEIALHNGWFEGTSLVVWDSLESWCGTKLEVYPAATAVGGFCGTIRDRLGNGFCAHAATREEAATKCVDGYLTLVNV